ncbi:MAG: biotin transporter BioY [Rhizobiales bacterium]|nr:biotin transporter BioY [Hyphomicrobiales bacterium]
MQTNNGTFPSLANALWPVSTPIAALRLIALAMAGSAFLTLCAKIHIDIGPVPVAMHTFAVLLIGAAYGLRLGLATIFVYLAQGAVGMPVFSGTPEKGIGMAYMMGPTGGYLLGFIFAVAIVGWFTDRGWDRSLLKMIPVMLLASIAIYIPGLLWLKTLLVLDWEKTFAFGITPFLYGDALKLMLAACVAPAAWAIINKFRGSN